MRQGNKQSLLYQWFDSLLKSEDEVGTFRILLDGWISRIRIISEVVTALDTVDEIVTILLSAREQDSQISTSQTYRNPFGSFAQEEVVAIHGLPDITPFPFFWTRSMDAGSFLDLELIRTMKVSAGSTLFVYLSSISLAGTNTAGELNTLVDIKQIVNPKRVRH